MLKKLVESDEARPVYDAEGALARCSECPFRGRRPVGPLRYTNPKLVILGESPGSREDETGRPFVGASGYLLSQALRQFGVSRDSLHITNTVLCRPKEKATEEEWDKAVECCKPRLEKELKDVSRTDFHTSSFGGRRIHNGLGNWQLHSISSNCGFVQSYQKKVDGLGSSHIRAGHLSVSVDNNSPTVPVRPVILACGNYALQSLTGRQGIFDWMGGPIETEYGTVIPSIHPAFALRNPAYIPIFKTFLSRALRIGNGQEDYPYVWPKFIWKPPYEEFLRRLLSSDLPLSVDIENDPDTDIIHCIGVGTTDLVVSVYLEWATREELTLLRVLLASAKRKVFQNGQFDRVKLEAAGYEVSGPIEDTLLQHAVVAPRLPHDLSFMAAVETTAERWKTIFGIKGEEKEKRLKKFSKVAVNKSPEKLLVYNCKDVYQQAKLYDSFNVRLSSVHRGKELYQEYLSLNEIALKMHKSGFKVDSAALKQHRESLQLVLEGLNKKFRELVPNEEYKLGVAGTHPSLRKLYFDKFNAPVVQWTDKRQPSLNDEALTHYIAHYTRQNAPICAEVSRIVLKVRKHAKLLTSYVDNIPVSPDGWIYPLWRVFGTRTGRWSATMPAIQTIPDGMKNIFVALGNLVAADYKQLEVRVLAHLSGSPILAQWFKEGRDVHGMTSEAVFEELNKRLGIAGFHDYESCKTKKKCIRCKQRYVCKRVNFNVIYGGSPETGWRALVVDFPDITLEQVELATSKFYEVHHHVKEWQDKVITDATTNLFVEEEWSGRRQYYQDGHVMPTEVPNFKIQGGAGWIVNQAVKRVDVALDWKTQFLRAQVHDELTLDVPEASAGAEILRSSMEVPVLYLGREMVYPCDISSGPNWKDKTAVI